jgi:hypothetical protein
MIPHFSDSFCIPAVDAGFLVVPIVVYDASVHRYCELVIF